MVWRQLVMSQPMHHLSRDAHCVWVQVVLMDHMDWLDSAAANTVAQELARAVAPGGRIIWRSAALVPPYNAFLAQAGFQVREPVILAGSDQSIGMYTT